MLSQRGLVFEDKERVCRYIRNIGYYRLSAYFYPFLEIPKDRQIFKQGSSFDAAIKPLFIRISTGTVKMRYGDVRDVERGVLTQKGTGGAIILS